MKVVALAADATTALQGYLDRLPGVTYVIAKSPAELHAAAPTADVLTLMNFGYTAELAALLKAEAKSLKLVQLLTAGYERVQQFGVPDGVAVATAGDARSPAVAEHTMAMLLALGRQIPAATLFQKERHWETGFASRVGSVIGKTLLIVGYGSIGGEVASRARAFGMKVIGVNRSGPKPGSDVELHPVSALNDLLPKADAVVVTAPSSPETVGLIGAKELGLMKSTAYLINVGRGEVVDTEALIAALKSGAVAGAALDVVKGEPIGPDDGLWDAPNLLVTPHVGGASGEHGRDRLASTVAANIQLLIEGNPLQWLVAL